jgi:hypothetical protein
MRHAVTDKEGGIPNLKLKMFAIVSTLSTLYRCCREHGLSKSTEINLEREIVKH